MSQQSFSRQSSSQQCKHCGGLMPKCHLFGKCPKFNFLCNGCKFTHDATFKGCRSTRFRAACEVTPCRSCQNHYASHSEMHVSELKEHPYGNCPHFQKMSQVQKPEVTVKQSAAQTPIVSSSNGRFTALAVDEPDEKKPSGRPPLPPQESRRQPHLQKLAGGGAPVAPVASGMDFSAALPSREKSSVSVVEKPLHLIDYREVREKAGFVSQLQEALQELPFMREQSPRFVKIFFAKIALLDFKALKSMLEDGASWDENLNAIQQQVEDQLAEEFAAEQQSKHFDLVNKIGDKLSSVVHDEPLLELMMSKVSIFSIETLEAMADPSRNDFSIKMDEIGTECKNELTVDGW